MTKLKITLVKSTIGRPERQKLCIQALGLRKIGHTVLRTPSTQIQGIINKVSHLIKVEEFEVQC